MLVLCKRFVLSAATFRPVRTRTQHCRAIIRACSTDTLHHPVQVTATRSFSKSHWRACEAEPKRNADQEEVDKFSRIAFNWWDESGDFKALHTLNALRIPLIRHGICKDSVSSVTQPLKGFRILDVGCGGGILSEPLSRLGGSVTGIDASEDNVKMAQWHASLDPSVARNVSYQCCLVEELADIQPQSFDGVVASEILEHVPNPKEFVEACGTLVKPGGSIFITSLNKTNLSYALGIVAAEQILRLVPKGAHDWNKFVPINDLKQMLLQNGFSIRRVSGMMLNPLTMRWSWFADTSINYALHAVKNNPPQSTTQSSSTSSSDSESDNK